MSTKPRWQTARIGDIPAAGLSAEPGYWKEWTDDEGYPTRWHSVREHFGIEAFGVNACHGEAGQEVVVPHEEESFGGQQELYAVIRGRVRFTCNDEACKTEHDFSILDWGTYVLHRSQSIAVGGAMAEKKVIAKLEEYLDLTRKDAYLFLGNTLMHCRNFMVVGVFYPPRPAPRRPKQVALPGFT